MEVSQNEGGQPTESLLQLHYFNVNYIISIMSLHASHFAQNINFPICKFLDQISLWPSNPDKESISFLSGDPTVYGQTQFQMPKRGYEILQQNILDQGHHGYINSVGIPQLRTTIKDLYHPKFQVPISNVLINSGVNMGLLNCLMALSNEGDQILVPELGYPFYQDLCPAMKRVAIPYRLKKESNFEIDLQHLATLITERTAFIYIINPTNPMGTVFSRKHMQQILSFSGRHQVPIVADEVYFKMVFPGVQALSFGQVTEDVPVIVLCGVQKILSVPGWVQSWIIIFDKHNILDQVKKNLQVIATIFLHTNVFTQYALPAIFKQIGIFTANQMPLIYNNYKTLTQRVQNIHGLKPLPAQGTIYLTIEIEIQKFKDIQNDIDFVRRLKLEESVNILPISIMGSGCLGLRLLTCAQDSLYNSFFERLEAFVSRHKKWQQLKSYNE